MNVAPDLIVVIFVQSVNPYVSDEEEDCLNIDE